MSEISKAVFGAIAITLTLGAVQFASGHDLVNRWQAVSEQPSHGKADRLADPKPFAVPMKTVSLRLNDPSPIPLGLGAHSVCTQARTTKPPMLLRKQGGNARHGPASPWSARSRKSQGSWSPAGA